MLDCTTGSNYAENADGFTYTDVLLQHGTKQQLASRGLGRIPAAIGDYVTSNVYYRYCFRRNNASILLAALTAWCISLASAACAHEPQL